MLKQRGSPSTSKQIRSAKFFLFFALLFLLYWKAPNYIGVPATSRFDVTRAIVERHTLNIDHYVQNTIDWSQHDGHYYSNKAPGVALLSVPIYWVMYQIENAAGISPEYYEIRNLRRTNVIVTVLPSALLSLFLLFYLLQRVPSNPRGVWMAVFVYAVGTIAFVYSALLWGHQTASAFLFFSFYATVKKKRNLAAAGFLFGMAVLCEYTAAMAAPALIAYVLFKDKWHPDNLKKLIPVALGGLPVFVVFGLYHKACFGGWLQLPYGYLNPRFGAPADHSSLSMMSLPDLTILYKLTFGLKKGLFPISPILLLSVAGFSNWLRDKKNRAEAYVALWIIGTYLYFNTSYSGWHGGNCAGPRYLTPTLPFMAAALAWIKPGRIYYALATLSAFNVAAILAVDPQPSLETNLLTGLIYPELVTRHHVWPIFAFMLGIQALLLILAIDKGRESRYL